MEFSIEKLLEKYKNFIPKEELVREYLVEILKKEVGVDIEKESISYNNGIIFLDGSPHLKGVVYRKKELIQKELSSRIKIFIKDLR